MAPKRNANGGSKAAAEPSTRKILVTAAEGQTGRLVLELLATGADYAGLHAGLSALVFSEEARASLAELGDVEVHVFDPADAQALVSAMEDVDTCLLIPPARKVRPHPRPRSARR